MEDMTQRMIYDSFDESFDQTIKYELKNINNQITASEEILKYRFDFEEEAIEAHIQEDPLEVYSKHADLIVKNSLKGHHALTLLKEIIEDALTNISIISYNYSSNLLKLFLYYLPFHDNKEKVFDFMQVLEIGINYSKLYIKHASFLEKQNRYYEAYTVYSRGIYLSAKPLDELKIRFKEFNERFERLRRINPKILKPENFELSQVGVKCPDFNNKYQESQVNWLRGFKIFYKSASDPYMGAFLRPEQLTFSDIKCGVKQYFSDSDEEIDTPVVEAISETLVQEGAMKNYKARCDFLNKRVQEKTKVSPKKWKDIIITFPGTFGDPVSATDPALSITPKDFSTNSEGKFISFEELRFEHYEADKNNSIKDGLGNPTKYFKSKGSISKDKKSFHKSSEAKTLSPPSPIPIETADKLKRADTVAVENVTKSNSKAQFKIVSSSEFIPKDQIKTSDVSIELAIEDDIEMDLDTVRVLYDNENGDVGTSYESDPYLLPSINRETNQMNSDFSLPASLIIPKTDDIIGNNNPRDLIKTDTITKARNNVNNFLCKPLVRKPSTASSESTGESRDERQGSSQEGSHDDSSIMR